MLISHPYVKVNRKIKNNEQHLIEIEESLVLYRDKVISASDYFRLQDILDMSFKSLSGESGFLYLHTNRGVFSFHTKTNPEEFIHFYQRLKEKL